GKWRLLERLSHQPIGRTRLDLAPVSWVMRRLEGGVGNPRGPQREGETRQGFEARRRVNVLDLTLASTFQPDDSREARYSLDAVTVGAGHAVPIARMWDDLLVQLPR